jgi:hypothetical protein
MMFVQSLRGISHNKIEHARDDRLEMSVVALDRLVTKAANRTLREQKRQTAIYWVIATTNMAEVFSQWTTKKSGPPHAKPARSRPLKKFSEWRAAQRILLTTGSPPFTYDL